MKNFTLIVLLAFSVTAHSQNGPDISTLKPVKSILSKSTLSKFGPDHNLNTIPSPQDHLSTSRWSAVQVIDSFYHWTWDAASGEWQKFLKNNEYEYNDDNLVTSYTTQIWTGANWMPVIRYMITYDGNNNPTLQVEQFWDGSAWKDSYRTVSTYDGAGNLLLQINTEWNGSAWVDARRQTFTYDANNNLLGLTIEHAESNQWINEVRYTYTYDAEGNLTNSLFEGWDGNQWENVNQSLYTYDSNGNQLTSVYQSWDTGGWLDIQRITTTYDIDNKKLSQTVEFWAINEWANYLLISFTYDGDLVTEQLVDTWNGFEWIDSELYTYAYDDNGNNIQYLRQAWNGQAWVNAEERNFSFDSDNNPIYEVYKTYTTSGDAIMSGDSLHYYYRTISGTGTVADDDAGILVYPNPGNGKVIISSSLPITSMVIYNLQGQIVDVYNGNFDQNKIEANLSKAGQGMYFAKIVCAGYSYIKVIVIQ